MVTSVSILKFEPRTPRSLEDMALYLKDERKTTADGLFGIGCNPSYAVLEMEFVQRIFFQEQLTHPYLQVIFAFDVGIKFPLQLIRVISQEIGQALIWDISTANFFFSLLLNSPTSPKIFAKVFWALTWALQKSLRPPTANIIREPKLRICGGVISSCGKSCKLKVRSRLSVCSKSVVVKKKDLPLMSIIAYRKNWLKSQKAPNVLSSSKTSKEFGNGQKRYAENGL